MTYTVPEADRTSLTQDFVASSWNASEQVEYQTKRKAWRDTYKVLESYHNAWAALYAAVEAL
jgi:hypothetical protein